MKRIRHIVILFILALIVPLVAACGQQDTQTSPTAPATGDQAPAPAAPGEAPAADGMMQVEDGAVLRVTSWGDASEQQINAESFARFQEMYPNVRIEYQPQPADYQTKMRADAAGGTMADVFYLDSGLMQAFAPEGLLLDLTPYLQEADVALSDYPEALLELFQLNGQTYGLPKDFNPLVLFVNNEMAQAAGIDPASITTWDAWNTAAAQMTTGEGNARIYGMCTLADAQRFGALILQQGIPIIEGSQANFTQPQAVEALSFWYGMYQNGHAQLPQELGTDWCGQAFGEGKTAMALEGGWMVPYLERDFPEVEYTALSLPTPPNGDRSSLLFTNAWAAAANTRYPRAAAALVMYLTSPENQRPILDAGFALPTHNAVLNDPAVQDDPTTRVLLQAAEYGTVSDVAFGREAKDDVIKALNDNVEAVFLGQADLQSALQTAEQEAESHLQ